MRQHQLGGHVADGPDAGHVGRHALVDLDRAALAQLDTQLLQTQALAVGPEADGNQGLFGFQQLFSAFFAGDHHLDSLLICHQRFDRVPGQRIDLAALEGLGQLRADLLIFQRQQAGQHLDQGDFDTIRIPDGGEFHPDGTGADDDD